MGTVSPLRITTPSVHVVAAVAPVPLTPRVQMSQPCSGSTSLSRAPPGRLGSLLWPGPGFWLGVREGQTAPSRDWTKETLLRAGSSAIRVEP